MSRTRAFCFLSSPEAAPAPTQCVCVFRNPGAGVGLSHGAGALPLTAQAGSEDPGSAEQPGGPVSPKHGFSPKPCAFPPLAPVNHGQKTDTAKPGETQQPKPAHFMAHFILLSCVRPGVCKPWFGFVYCKLLAVFL